MEDIKGRLVRKAGVRTHGDPMPCKVVSHPIEEWFANLLYLKYIRDEVALHQRSKAGVWGGDPPKAGPHNTALNPFLELKMHNQRINARTIIWAVVRWRQERMHHHSLSLGSHHSHPGERLRNEECRVLGLGCK